MMFGAIAEGQGVAFVDPVGIVLHPFYGLSDKYCDSVRTLIVEFLRYASCPTCTKRSPT